MTDPRIGGRVPVSGARRVASYRGRVRSHDLKPVLGGGYRRDLGKDVGEIVAGCGRGAVRMLCDCPRPGNRPLGRFHRRSVESRGDIRRSVRRCTASISAQCRRPVDSLGSPPGMMNLQFWNLIIGTLRRQPQRRLARLGLWSHSSALGTRHRHVG